MNIIEKLEGLLQKPVYVEVQVTQAFQPAVLADDLRAIIEEYKNAQEPVGYTSQQWIDTVSDYSSGIYWKTGGGYLGEDYVIPLFTHPPLSDETVKDAERYAFLRDNCAYETVTGCWDIEFLEHGDTLDEAIDREIDEVKKAANAETKA